VEWLGSDEEEEDGSEKEGDRVRACKASKSCPVLLPGAAQQSRTCGHHTFCKLVNVSSSTIRPT